MYHIWCYVIFIGEPNDLHLYKLYVHKEVGLFLDEH